MLTMVEADLAAKFDRSINLPAGYVLISVVRYPNGRNPMTGKQMAYNTAVQLVHEDDLKREPSLGAIKRGVGDSVDEAIQHVIDNL